MEKIWNKDFLKELGSHLSSPYKLFKGKVLKDVFLCSHKTSNRKLQLGFVDQDVVIYKDELDISCLYNDNSFFIHRSIN